MAFPDKFLWFNLGWKDRGNVGSTRTWIGLEVYRETFGACAFCGTRARVGIEGKLPFKYCPKCLVKIQPENKHCTPLNY